MPFESVRTEELRRLEMCERALADAYRRHALRPGADRRRALKTAARHLEHAALLRHRLLQLGGRPGLDSDSEWLRGPEEDLTTLRMAEYASLQTYHDHLNDHDPETMKLMRDLIVPEHAAALDALDEGEPATRRPEL
jgi:hypothetical protein